MFYNIDIIDTLFISFKNNEISDEMLLDQLVLQLDDIDKINDYDEPKKNIILEIIANIDINQDIKYKQLYLEFTKIYELWTIEGKYGFTLLQMMCYNGNDMYYDILDNLIKHQKLWEKKHQYGGNTALHMLILTCKNQHKMIFCDIIKKLTKYPKLWLIENDSKITPMHELCEYKNDMIFDILEEFIDYYCVTLWEKKDNELMTPLHYLCMHKPNNENKNKYINIIKKLTQFENIWSMQDKFMYTPFHFLSRNFIGSEYDEIYNRLYKSPVLWRIRESTLLTRL
jgi:hypothetical protein